MPPPTWTPPPPPPPALPQWLCCICAAIVGGRAVPARCLVGGDTVCLDHLILRAESASLSEALATARADLAP
jgi:hypothetical protein